LLSWPKRSDTAQKLRAELSELRKERTALEAVARDTEQKDKDIVRLEAELKQLEQSRLALEQEVKARDQELILTLKKRSMKSKLTVIAKIGI
jgi:cell division protein FtsB